MLVDQVAEAAAVRRQAVCHKNQRNARDPWSLELERFDIPKTFNWVAIFAVTAESDLCMYAFIHPLFVGDINVFVASVWYAGRPTAWDQLCM